MIDTHCHALFGVDDGAKTIEDSMIMLKIAKEDGVNKVIFTSHCLPGIKFENDYASLKIVYDQVVAEAKTQKLDLELYLACELMATPDSLQWLRQNKVATYNNTKWVLVEIPWHREVQFDLDEDTYIKTVLDMGYKVILAHPERYPQVQKNYAKLAYWKSLGCAFQVNRTSLLDPTREIEYPLAWKMIEDGYCDTIGSDAHRTSGIRVIALSDVYKMIEERYGPERAALLMIHNPQRLIDGKDMNHKESEKASC